MIKGDTNLEKLQDSLIHGLIHVATSQDADFTIEAARELQEIREEDKMDELEAFNNALWFCSEDEDDRIYWKNKKGEFKKHSVMLGWENTEKIFAKFIKRYPAITKALTIYCYS